ncbi:FtsW/RodA/SpoVE family cell cycle protein [Halobacillus locisalis]|uniref:FtsW/RodA/SpoVE family cell cycle protein n=1 Tax=Halobacillus locisalis TaxID=220753 RepID=A0A838CV88_9BACI|nr:FtsW/RodA/SpoVE family cell cycle protein [Halobacillus locisalis]MBA2176052.1 FtsW/RodA/SpoVE family cell cycle protein [Halobacillus locisalis]
MKMDKTEYLAYVEQFIKNKEAKQIVSKELTYHIEQEKRRLMQSGKLSEEESEQEAVQQMGSPVEVGKHFNQMYRPRTDWWMIALLIISIGFSFLPVLVFDQEIGNLLVSKYFYTLMGVVMVATLFFFDYRKLQKWGWVFYGAGCVGMYCLAYGYGPVIHVMGTPIMQAGPLSVRAIYFLPLFILGFSSLFASPKAKLWKGLVLVTIPSYFYLNAADFSSLVILLVVFFTMAWYRNLNRKAMLGLIAGGIAAIAVRLWVAPLHSYQLERFYSFLRPQDYAESQGYTYLKVQEMLSETGWFGHSGNLEDLPSGHTDFVLVSLIYNYGWVVSILTILVLLSLMARLVAVNTKINDTFGNMLIIGGLAFYSFPLLYQVLMSFGLLPFIGISLPFLSYGLHPMVLHAIVFGLVLSVYRRKDVAGKVPAN